MCIHTNIYTKVYKASLLGLPQHTGLRSKTDFTVCVLPVFPLSINDTICMCPIQKCGNPARFLLSLHTPYPAGHQGEKRQALSLPLRISSSTGQILPISHPVYYTELLQLYSGQINLLAAPTLGGKHAPPWGRCTCYFSWKALPGIPAPLTLSLLAVLDSSVSFPEMTF